MRTVHVLTFLSLFNPPDKPLWIYLDFLCVFQFVTSHELTVFVYDSDRVLMQRVNRLRR